MRTTADISMGFCVAFLLSLTLISTPVKGEQFARLEKQSGSAVDELDDARAQIEAVRKQLAQVGEAASRQDVEDAFDTALRLKSALRAGKAQVTATCPAQTITIPANISGSLTGSSCIDPVLGNREDVYAFAATAGQRVTITMSSRNFSVFLYMYPANATQTAFLSSGGVSTMVIDYVIPSSGTYKVEAEALYPPTSTQPSSGAYTLVIATGSSTPPSANYPTHSCGLYPITCGGSQSGFLTFGSCTLTAGNLVDLYTFSGKVGDTVSVSLSVASSTFTRPFVAILPPQGDNTPPEGATGSGSATVTNFRLTSTGTWAIGVSSLDVSASGNYTVSLTCNTATTPPPTSGSCQVNSQSMCLAGNRFAVSVAWKTSDGKSGSGTQSTLTSDSGYFWFFQSSNVELVVKVLDGRTLNGKFWVFYGALSDVEYTITVRDTVTGAVKTYRNPPKTLASVADTSAF